MASFDHHKRYEDIKPLNLAELTAFVTIDNASAEVALIVKSVAHELSTVKDNICVTKRYHPNEIEALGSELWGEWCVHSGVGSIVELMIRSFMNAKGGLLSSVWFGNANKRCQKFFTDFATAVDLYGESICYRGHQRRDNVMWRPALLLMLEAEDRLGAGYRALSPFGAWAVTIAYTFNFPAAVSHHVDAPILTVDPKATGLSIHHYCRYFYFMGLIAAEYGRFEESCCHFETAIEVRNAASIPFAVAASKGLVVVSAVARGEVAHSLIRESPQTAPFVRFAELYLSSSRRTTADERAIIADIEKHAHVMGLHRLAQLCLSDRLGQLILRLTKIYANLPLNEIARSVGVTEGEAKSQIDLLVATGRIRAFCDPATGIVHFSEISTVSRSEVEETIRRAIALADALDNVRTRVETSRDFVRSTPEFEERIEREVAVAAAR